MAYNSNIPVITIDGPSGSGKGTLACLLAKELGWHILDSGVLYRVLALLSKQQGIEYTNEEELVSLAEEMPVKFVLQENLSLEVWLNGLDVSTAVRHEEIGNLASKISGFQSVRTALMDKQRSFRQLPGLVTDGRDMGTVVFPEAQIKLFLIASSSERAERRYKQLKNKGIDANLAQILNEIEERDFRDTNRVVAPLKPAADSIIIDSSGLVIEEVFAKALDIIKHRLGFLGDND